MNRLLLLLWIAILTQMNIVSAQQSLGAISSGSISKNSPFSVGEVFIEGQLSGQLGVYSFLLATSLLTDSEDLILEDQYSIFPNPTLGSFEIKSTGVIIKNIMVMDGNGKLVRTISNAVQNDISDLVPGMYFININQKQVFKIIKK